MTVYVNPDHITIDVSAILSDLDGTLIDSTAAIIRYWTEVGLRYNIAPYEILRTSHGRRSIDVFRDIDPSMATWEYVCELEGAVPRRFGGDAVAISGARALLESLSATCGWSKWAIVTSGTRGLASGWLDVLNFGEPPCMVTAEDVQWGKPEPECYLRAAEMLGIDQSPDGVARALVLEDAPSGVRAGKAAGCRVLGVATTHSADELRRAGAEWVVPDLRSLKVIQTENKSSDLCVEISGWI